jgi:CBS domain-containing protein
MNIREAMTSTVETISPTDTVWYAAARMKELDIGLLPVTRDGRAVGVVTDRDLALRSCGEGSDPRTTQVDDVMTREVIECRETQPLADAGRLMEEKKVRRLLVTNEEGLLVGLLSVDDLATRLHDPSVFSRVLRDVSLGLRPESSRGAS